MEQTTKLPVLEFLTKQISSTLCAGETTHMAYPTRISLTLGIRLVDVGNGMACVEMDVDSAIHGNQQGTVHGGLMSELADSAIGTAHSTTLTEGESFASIDLKVNFFRPVWNSTLRASARGVHSGNTISHYLCEIVREDGVLVAMAMSAVMTLRGQQAMGR